MFVNKVKYVVINIKYILKNKSQHPSPARAKHLDLWTAKIAQSLHTDAEHFVSKIKKNICDKQIKIIWNAKRNKKCSDNSASSRVQMPKHELMNTQRCFQHGYGFPHMNYSTFVPLEEKWGGGGGCWKQAGEETHVDKKGNDGREKELVVKSQSQRSENITFTSKNGQQAASSSDKLKSRASFKTFQPLFLY